MRYSNDLFRPSPAQGDFGPSMTVHSDIPVSASDIITKYSKTGIIDARSGSIGKPLDSQFGVQPQPGMYRAAVHHENENPSTHEGARVARKKHKTPDSYAQSEIDDYLKKSAIPTSSESSSQQAPVPPANPTPDTSR